MQVDDSNDTKTFASQCFIANTPSTLKRGIKQ